MHDPGAAAFPLAASLLQEHQQLRCPRCDSTNTKFCYYNNYNLSQPRHFCRDCRRYWTRGGALRNVPVGGGTRKNSKRGPPSSSSPSSPSKRSNTLSSSPPSPAASSAAALASPSLQISTSEHISPLGFTPDVFSTQGATNQDRPVGVSSFVELRSRDTGGGNSGKPRAPPLRMPAQDDNAELHGDSNCRNSSPCRPDLSMFSPRSEFQ